MRRTRDEWQVTVGTVLPGALPATLRDSFLITEVIVPIFHELPEFERHGAMLAVAAVWVACAVIGAIALWRTAFFRVGWCVAFGLVAAVVVATTLAIGGIQASSKMQGLDSLEEEAFTLSALLPLLVAAIHIYRFMKGTLQRRM
jgi:hypothetical protein